MKRKLAAHLKTAFKANAAIAEMDKDIPADPNGLVSPSSLAVAKDLGFTEEEADELMVACLYMAQPRVHPDAARKDPQIVTLAVGAFYGVLGRVHQERLH